jgi:hypothetical protein
MIFVQNRMLHSKEGGYNEEAGDGGCAGAVEQRTCRGTLSSRGRDFFWRVLFFS